MPRLQLTMKPKDYDRLVAYARNAGCPNNLSAAIRHAASKVFREEVKEGRPLGYSPKRQKQTTWDDVKSEVGAARPSPQ
jgi:hypothetical protein